MLSVFSHCVRCVYTTSLYIFYIILAINITYDFIPVWLLGYCSRNNVFSILFTTKKSLLIIMYKKLSRLNGFRPKQERKKIQSHMFWRTPCIFLRYATVDVVNQFCFKFTPSYQAVEPFKTNAKYQHLSEIIRTTQWTNCWMLSCDKFVYLC